MFLHQHRPSPPAAPPVPAARAFRFARGVHVTDPSGVHEAYDVIEAGKDYWAFTINVSAERVGEAFRRLARRVARPGYFFVEAPTPDDVEASLRRSPADPFHLDVYHLDGIGRRRALSIFNRYEGLFVHDGRTQVGFGSHAGLDEVYVGPYKILRVFTRTAGKYTPVLRRMGIPREPRLVTAWNSFTPATPGRRTVLPGSPIAMSHMLTSLEHAGMYFAARRDDPAPPPP